MLRSSFPYHYVPTTAADAMEVGRSAVRGASTFARRVGRRVANAIVRRGVVHLYGWDLAASVEYPTPPGFLGRELDPRELADAAAHFGRPPGQYHHRVRLGDRCFGAFAGPELVHVRWVARRPVEIVELGLLICPGAGEVYVYDSLTDPAYRGQGASSAARAAMDDALIREGVRRGFAYVRGDNHASLRTLGDYHQLLCVLSYRGVLGRPTRAITSFAHPLYQAEAVPLVEEPVARVRDEEVAAEVRPGGTPLAA